MIEIIIFFVALATVTLIADMFGLVNPGLDKVCEEQDASFKKYEEKMKYDY